MRDFFTEMSTPDFGFRISDYGLRITDYGLRITDYGFRISDLGFGISDVVVWGTAKMIDGWFRLPE